VRPRLILGLGNPIAGDDGVGAWVARRLADHPGLPGHTDVVAAGTDLLRLAPVLLGRSQLILIDAISDGAEPGTLTRFDGDLDDLDDRDAGVHQLSPIAAIRLLQGVYPELRSTAITLLAISVRHAAPSTQLSPAIADRLDAVVTAVLAILADQPPACST
jgi:hydrogenase maturation protease